MTWLVKIGVSESNVQKTVAYRTDKEPKAVAVTSGGGGGGQGWGGVPREGLQGLLSGQGSTALRGQTLTVVDVPVILQVEFQQSKLYVWMVAQIQFIDRVLRVL